MLRARHLEHDRRADAHPQLASLPLASSSTELAGKHGAKPPGNRSPPRLRRRPCALGSGARCVEPQARGQAPAPKTQAPSASAIENASSLRDRTAESASPVPTSLR